MLAPMNYGQLLEVLKNAGPDQLVHLRGSTTTLLIDLVMADETGVYLVNEPERSPGCLSAVDLLTALRAIETQPEFTADVFGDSPGGTGPVFDAHDIDGEIFFDAPAVGAKPTDAELAEQFGPGEPLGDAELAQRGPGNPAHENAAIDSTTHGMAHLIQHDFEPVPGFETQGPGGSAPLCVHCDQAADAPVHQIDVTPRHLSPPAAGVLDAMGLGMRLRVPRDGGPAMLDDSTDQGRESLGPVNPDHVQELIDHGRITKLTKDRNGTRLGWAEKGLDGDAADFYVCTQ